MATIDDLNTYCLIEIFSYVDIRERQRLELVCKRWRLVNQIIWRSMRKFEFTIIGSNDTFSLIPIHNGVKVKCADISHFGEILKKFAGNLEKLAIITEFEWAQELDIPKWIFNLIIENENLNSVEINVYNKRIYSKCLQFLKTKNLRHLKLSNHIKFKKSTSVREAVKTLLINASRLETLHVSNIPISMQKISRVLTLKSLRIDTSELRDLPVEKFKLINLESIHLTQCKNVDDKFIVNMVDLCRNILNVEIYGCKSISVKGLIAITTLPKLRHFGALEMNDEVFDKLSKIETLTCPILRLNQNTMNTSFANFFRRSPNLKMAHVCVNGDFGLFDECAREFGIELDQNGEYRRSCICRMNWKKQFYNSQEL